MEDVKVAEDTDLVGVTEFASVFAIWSDGEIYLPMVNITLDTSHAG
jgi:hypothetical protein